MNDADPAPMDLTIALPGGTTLSGTAPVVIIGPNGSGKTRQARQITSPIGAPVAFVNALRNTRVTTEIPSMGLSSARSNLVNQGNQARSHYWELVNDFDVLLARLQAEDAEAAIAYRTAARANESPVSALSSMELIQAIWQRIFPGRSLSWKDNIPMVRSSVPGSQPSYQGHFMSDGEKAALYLAGKVLVAEPGVLVVDEPETHFHSLLAVEFWNALEIARDDLRLVYVTHDLAFGMSRRNAIFVLAVPTGTMRVIDGLDEFPTDAAEMLLGAASFSFYARRLVLCEGEQDGLDHQFYSSWFRDLDTVVRAIGSSDLVIRAAGVLKRSNLVVGLEPVGIIDRDFHSDDELASLPEEISVLPVHEIESLYCLPSVVSAVAQHLGKADPFDEVAYVGRLRAAISNVERHKVIIERWKRRVEGPLLALIGDVASRTTDLDAVVAAVPEVFDQSRWGFSPTDVLARERALVEGKVPGGTVEEILAFMPGKSLLSIASGSVGLGKDDYRQLVNSALAGSDRLVALGVGLDSALSPLLPPRVVTDPPAAEVDSKGFELDRTST